MKISNIFFLIAFLRMVLKLTICGRPTLEWETHGAVRPRAVLPMGDNLTRGSTMAHGAGAVRLTRCDVVEDVLHCFTMR